MKLKSQVGICGVFGDGIDFSGGQPVKVKTIIEEFKRNYKQYNIKLVNTKAWKKNPSKLFFQCINLIIKCENIIILPAQNGVKVFLPLFAFLNKLYNKKLHYVVIGGWLPSMLKEKQKLIKYANAFNGIYVETHSMVSALNGLGLSNVYYLPNSKNLEILNEDELVFNNNKPPYKLCTFSRVMKEKGIEDAINAVKSVNKKLNCTVFVLDIYGTIDENYYKEFNKIMSNSPQYISYKGVINYDKSVETIKYYFALLFPTYYCGEGFAGTILDAFAAGVPLIATDWRYNAEIIQNKINGLIYNYKKPEMLEEILLEVYDNPNEIIGMKKNCLKRAGDYSAETVVRKLVDYF